MDVYPQTGKMCVVYHANPSLCQPHSLKGCHNYILFIKLPITQLSSIGNHSEAYKGQ